MHLSVIIVNYKVPLFLRQCLESVRRALDFPGIEADIWVVDNNSEDESVALCREAFPDVHYIENEENEGFARANNRAIEASEGRYVLLLNPDTIIGETCLIDCLAFMDAHLGAGALGVYMMDARGRFLPESKRGYPTLSASCFKLSGLYRLAPRSRKFGQYYMGWLPEEDTEEVEILAGAFMMIRREALDRVGLLDERFFMYGEDIDLSHRIRQGGYACYYFPEQKILHYKGESNSVSDLKYIRSFYGAMQLFYEKHYGSSGNGCLRLAVEATIAVRIGLAKVMRRLRLWSRSSGKKPVPEFIPFKPEEAELYLDKRDKDLLIDTSGVSYDSILRALYLLRNCGHTVHLQAGAGAPIVSPADRRV